MKINKIIFLVGAFACTFARADTPDFIDMQISELTERRDALRAELESCESNTQKYKIAGISTLAATGVGVVGNVALHNKIQSASGAGRRSAATVAGAPQPNTLTTEQKGNDMCEMFCEDDSEMAANNGCEC